MINFLEHYFFTFTRILNMISKRQEKLAELFMMTVFTVIYYGTWYFVNGLKVRSRVYRSFSVPKQKSFRFRSQKSFFFAYFAWKRNSQILKRKETDMKQNEGKKLFKK